MKKSVILISLIVLLGCATTINIEKIEEYYKNSDEEKLENILNNPENLENPENIDIVENYYNEIKKKRIENEIINGIKDKDEKVLGLIVSGEYEKYASKDQKNTALIEYKKILIKKVDKEINEAIDQGNCEKLYEYAVNKKDLINKQQLLTAQKYLKLYTDDDLNVKKYKNDKMDKAVRLIPKDLQQNIFIDPENNINELVLELSKRSSDQYIKAKIIHDWICDNISYDAEDFFNLNEDSPQDYISVLKRKKAVCAGYSELFKKMAEIAGFETVIISGYSKGYGYRAEINQKSNHAWNGIKISNKWYLIDCTWDAGNLDRKTFVKEYSTEYLFINSSDNLFTHLPKDDKYQFYYPYLSHDDFIKEPKINGKFFQYGLNIDTSKINYNNIITESPFVLNIISNNRNVVLFSKMRNESDRNVIGTSIINRKGNNYKIYYSPPDNNIYSCNVFARLSNEINFPRRIYVSEFENYYLPRIDKLIKEKKYSETIKDIFINSYKKIEENNRYYYLEDQFDIKRINTVYNIFKEIDGNIKYSSSVLDINIQNEKELQNIITYPETYSNYSYLLNTEIIEPINRSVKSNTNIDFVIRTTDYNFLAIVVDSNWTYFEKRNIEYYLNYKVPNNVEKITIYGSKSKKATYDAIASYYVE